MGQDLKLLQCGAANAHIDLRVRDLFLIVRRRLEIGPPKTEFPEDC